MTPTVTRKPLPWPFWAGMAVELASSVPAMGVFTLMCVSTYCRPSELLSLRRCDLVAPSPGVLKWWSLLLFPEEEGRASKTSQFNDSIELDDDRLSAEAQGCEQAGDGQGPGVEAAGAAVEGQGHG